MSYVSEGSVADLFDEGVVERAALRMTEAVGGHWVGEVARRTPVAEVPEAYGDDIDSWIEDRGGRRPGTARRSWRAQPPRLLGNGVVRVIVDSDDYPVIVFIEHDTRPHTILPKRAKSLRFPFGPTFRYQGKVEHPGTEGVHMQRDTMAALEAGWRLPAEIALERSFAAEG